MGFRAEFIRLCSPVKRELRALDTHVRREYNQLLNELIDGLRREGFRLREVSKRYQCGARYRADSFWCSRKLLEQVEVDFICKLTTAFGGGFEIFCDLDFYLRFPVIYENFRNAAAKEVTLAPQTQLVAKEEIERAWQQVEGELTRGLAEFAPGSWGRHGVPQAILEGRPRICHLRELSLRGLEELSSFLRELRETQARVMQFVEDSKELISELASAAFEKHLPPPVKNEVQREIVSALLRYPKGLFEYQLRRHLHSRFRVSPRSITDQFLRLELWGYIKVHETPPQAAKRLEGIGIVSRLSFFTVGTRAFENFKPVATARMGLEPASMERVLKTIGVPEHLVSRAIFKLVRQHALVKFRTLNYRGESIVALRVRKWPKNPTGLELRILDLVARHYREQEKALDEAREILWGQET